MSFISAISSTPREPADRINPTSDLTHLFTAAAKPHAEWAIGAEMELLGYTRERLARIDPAQVQAIVGGFSPQTISRVTEDGFVTEAALPSARLTLEPGGQIEFSSAPHRSLAETEQVLRDYVKKL